MDVQTRRAFVLGVIGTVVVFAVLFTLVDGSRVLSALAMADPAFVAATVGFGICWLVAWSLMLRTILGALGIDLPYGRAFLVYATAAFANNVTPFGQAGGEPIAALLISKVSDSRYESGLVGIASVDVLNVVPSLGLIVFGVGYYAMSFRVTDELYTAVGSVGVLVVGIVIAFSLVWRFRFPLVDRIATALARIVSGLRWGRFESATATHASITDRLHRFIGNVEVVATDRRRLALALGFSTLGWLFQVAALFFAFVAIGSPVPVYVVFFAVPLGNLAGATPLPGGLGGIEAAFVALLVPTTGLEAAIVTAAVVVYRSTIYGLPVVIGGGSATAYGVQVLE